VTARGGRRVEVRGPLELAVQLAPDGMRADAAGLDAVVQRLPAVAGVTVQRFEVVVDGWRFEVSVEDVRHAELREKAARAAREHAPAGAASLHAQIPGRVTKVWVEAGQAVEAGDRLLAVEAMKMENELRAPHAGRVEAVHVEPGQTVERDDPLVSLA
jgi:glutaconyl-CoA/methylmalonyl-CoA decarboxylase subunit gamma